MKNEEEKNDEKSSASANIKTKQPRYETNKKKSKRIEKVEKWLSFNYMSQTIIRAATPNENDAASTRVDALSAYQESVAPASQTINASKKKILINWLKDYNKFVQVTQQIKKERRKKAIVPSAPPPTPVNDNDSNQSTNKTLLKNIRFVKSSFRRIICYLVIISIFLCILSIITGLLVKFLYLDKQHVTNDNVCSIICPNGFETYVDSSGTCNCKDINECLRENDCLHYLGQYCSNIPGGYSCLCSSGFTQVNSTPIVCEDVNECLDIQTCSYAGGSNCSNLIGSFQCVCPNGFIWSNSSESCVDFNECLYAKNPCGINQICFNTHGSYYCECDTGFSPSTRQTPANNRKIDCIDVNECLLNSSIYKCPANTNCLNTNGSYLCCQQTTCTLCGMQTIQPITRIVGGVQAVDNSWPWIVLIGINYKFNYYSPILETEIIQWLNITNICGGVLISDSYILTAAHCVNNLVLQIQGKPFQIKVNEYHKTLESIFTIYVGVSSTNMNDIDINFIFKLDSMIQHENFDSYNYLNDIAILKLNKRVQKSTKSGWICLPQSNKTSLPINQTVFVAGFGAISQNGPSNFI